MRVICITSQPGRRVGKRLVRVCAEEVERVAGFVDEEGQVAVDAIEHCDVAVRVVGPGRVGCGSGLAMRRTAKNEKGAHGQVG